MCIVSTLSFHSLRASLHAVAISYCTPQCRFVHLAHQTPCHSSCSRQTLHALAIHLIHAYSPPVSEEKIANECVNVRSVVKVQGCPLTPWFQWQKAKWLKSRSKPGPYLLFSVQTRRSPSHTREFQILMPSSKKLCSSLLSSHSFLCNHQEVASVIRMRVQIGSKSSREVIV